MRALSVGHLSMKSSSIGDAVGFSRRLQIPRVSSHFCVKFRI